MIFCISKNQVVWGDFTDNSRVGLRADVIIGSGEGYMWGREEGIEL